MKRFLVVGIITSLVCSSMVWAQLSSDSCNPLISEEDPNEPLVEQSLLIQEEDPNEPPVELSAMLWEEDTEDPNEPLVE